MARSDLATVKTRLEQAARLVASCRDVLEGWRPAHLGDEIARRDIEPAALALLVWTLELARKLSALKLSLRAEHCPHCAWTIAPQSVERCPRCNGPREVRDESASRDHRNAS